MWNSIVFEIKTMINKKGFCTSFIVMLVFSLFSFVVCASRSWGEELSQVLSADSQFMGNAYSPTWYFFTYLFSFIIVLPHSLSYITDLELGTYSVIVVRSGKKQYLVSKIFATFIGNFVLITIPFLVNLILCHLTFSNEPNFIFGEYGLPNYFRTIMGTNYVFSAFQKEIPFLPIFLLSPTLYNILYILILGFASGIFGVLVLSISFIFSKRRAYLFAPVYLLMLLTSVLSEYSYSKAVNNPGQVFINFDLMDYLAAFGYPGKSALYIAILLVISLAFCIATFIKALYNDQLIFEGNNEK